MINAKHLLFIAGFAFFVCLSTAVSSDTVSTKILIAPIQIAPKCDYIDRKDAYEALRLSIELSKTNQALPKYKIDSLINARQSIITQVDLGEVAKSLGADKIAFSSIRSIGNVIRTEIIIKSTKDPTFLQKGVGYAMLNMRDIVSDDVIYVPALITAFQKAFALCNNDTLMYDSYRNAYRVFPTPTLAVCGIDFIRSDSAMTWELFRTKQTASYDMVETVFSVAALDKNFFTYDIDTRDTIYKVFGLFEKMNFNAPSDMELESLFRFDLDYIITGTLQFNNEKHCLELELMMFKFINDGFPEKVRSYKELVHKDKVDMLRYAVTKATLKLLFGDKVAVPEYIEPPIEE